MRVFGLFKKDEAGSLLANVAIMGAVVAILSVGAAYWLAQSMEHGVFAGKSEAVIYSQRVRSVLDPQTTGSISQSANATRLDPCAADSRSQ
jgi:uncharacterized membrane protein